jgi:outer membrane protein TolC
VYTEGGLPRPALPDEERLAAMEAELDKLPGLRERLARSERARANAELARARSGWATQLGAGVTREYPGDWIAGLTLSVELPRRNRTRETQSLARSAAVMEEGRFRRERAEARASYRGLVHELEHSQERIERLQTNELPALREAEAALEELGSSGESTLFEVLQVRAQRREAQLSLIEAEAEHAWVRVQLHLILNQMEERR